MGGKIVQYGAGNIGRSLVGQLFSNAGWEVVFVDVMEDIIDALNQRHEYEVVVKEQVESSIRVNHVRGVNGKDTARVIQEIATCDMLSTAVGPAILPRIAPVIAQAIAQRSRPLNVLLCENLRGAPQMMTDAMMPILGEDFPFEDRVGLIATSIGKMVPIMPVEVRKRDPLEVWAEAYNKIVADRHGFIGEIPDVPGLVVKNCFEAYVDQKLFVHNLGHAAAAYLGDHRGLVTIAQAMAIPEIADLARAAMTESGEALLRHYPDELTSAEMEDHISDLCKRFANHALGDTVFRVGRDRPRKFAPNDRLIGALHAHHKAGISSPATLAAAAAGIYFSAADEEGHRFIGDVEFDQIRDARGISGVLEQVSNLSRKDPIELEWIQAIESLSIQYKNRG